MRCRLGLCVHGDAPADRGELEVVWLSNLEAGETANANALRKGSAEGVRHLSGDRLSRGTSPRGR